MSTPCGIHDPISPDSFSERVYSWHDRLQFCEFRHLDYREIFRTAKQNDLIYCDPPYVDSQTILYGAQHFSIQELYTSIEEAKSRGVFVALSIDGSKNLVLKL